MSFAFPIPVPSALRARMSVIALVLAAHLGLLWAVQATPTRLAKQQMSVSVELQEASQAAMPRPERKSQAKPARIEKPVRAEQAVASPASVPVEPLAATPVSSAATHTPATASDEPVEADSEPDYQARYLNNPHPSYPSVAQRMGWGGRVLLDVEVLSTGACGSVRVFSSSGHELLDKAAMDAVKIWQFIPARHAGHTVTRWFRIPINFSLKDNEA